MRIGIDARVLDRKITGTGRYLLNILNELPKHDLKNEYYIFTSTELSVDKNFYKIIHRKRSIIPMKLYSPLWLNYELPKLVKEYKIDVLFEPNVLVPIVDLGKTKIVSVVHDVIPWIYPKYYPFFFRHYLSLFFSQSIKRCEKIITVSETSKQDIVRLFGAKSSSVSVAYNTAANHFNLEDVASNIHEKLNLPDKYLLYVGVIEKRKNIMALIQIMDELKKRESDFKLLIIGRKGYDSDNIMPEILKRSGSIRYISYMDDESLAATYKKAFAFIFPTYYEGFGIPPLEAMRCGVPVLASNVSAMVEVVGDGGYLHLPDDIVGFVNDILKLEHDDLLYKLMKSKAIEQANKFNIHDTTQHVVDVLNQLINNNSVY